MSSNTAAISSNKSTTKVASSASIARPSLKNLSRARVPRAGVIGFTIAAVAAVSWKLFVSDRRKHNIAAFYKTFDPERDYARMKAAGVFKGLQGRERPEWLDEYESELDNAIASLKGSVEN